MQQVQPWRWLRQAVARRTAAELHQPNSAEVAAPEDHLQTRLLQLPLSYGRISFYFQSKSCWCYRQVTALAVIDKLKYRRSPLNLFSIDDLSETDFEWILKRGSEHASRGGAGVDTLTGSVIGILFTKTSTRTRTAFSAAGLRLGGGIITYQERDLQLTTGETYEDTGQVFSRMLDGLVVRTAESPEKMQALAAGHDLPVINAMDQDEHPTQALCDLTYLTTRFGSLDGLRFLYLGEGNNTATALCLALARLRDSKVSFLTPSGYGLPRRFLASARHVASRTGAEIVESHDLQDLPLDVDVVYTTRWTTTGAVKEDPAWQEKFSSFRVSEELLERYPHALLMHDLPAHRGEEIDAAVIDGPQSVVMSQAACKMFSAMAVLEWALLSSRPGGVERLQ